MGVWCSEGCNPNPKEISARVKRKVTASSIFTRKEIFLHQEKFFLEFPDFSTKFIWNFR
jgi:hypothetical protein